MKVEKLFNSDRKSVKLRFSERTHLKIALPSFLTEQDLRLASLISWQKSKFDSNLIILFHSVNHLQNSVRTKWKLFQISQLICLREKIPSWINSNGCRFYSLNFNINLWVQKLTSQLMVYQGSIAQIEDRFFSSLHFHFTFPFVLFITYENRYG